MDVDPATPGRFPTDLRLSYLDDSRQVSVGCEVEVGDGDASTGITLTDVAGLVFWIGDEDVPLIVYHVGVEVVRATRVVGVVPRVDPARVGLVGHVHECDRDLSWISPFADIGVGCAGVDDLVLDDDVFATVVLEIFDVENLCVRVVIDTGDGCVQGIGDVDDVHL